MFWRWHKFLTAFLAVNNSEISDLHHIAKANTVNLTESSLIRMPGALFIEHLPSTILSDLIDSKEAEVVSLSLKFLQLQRKVDMPHLVTRVRSYML